MIGLPLVSCIIPAHNEEAHLSVTIESLLAQDYPTEKLEILVALNGCTDGSLAIAQRYPVRVVQSDQKGMSFGKNLGGYAAFGNLLVFVDADTILPPEGIGAIVAELRAYDHAIATMAGVPGSGGLLVKTAFWIANIYTRRTRTHSPGGVIALNRDLYAAIGGFDEELPQGTSTDLVQRACNAGAEYVNISSVHATTSIRRFEKTGVISQMIAWRKNHKMLRNNERDALSTRTYLDVR